MFEDNQWPVTRQELLTLVFHMVNLIDDKCIIINSICIHTAQIEKGNIFKLSCKKVSKHPKGVDFLKLVLLLSEVNPTHKLIHSSSDY